MTIPSPGCAESLSNVVPSVIPSVTSVLPSVMPSVLSGGGTWWPSGEALWESVVASLALPCSAPEAARSRLIVFDWDDTLLPTTALALQGLFPSALEADPDEILACAKAGCEALRIAKQHGRVIIVTNAVSGWVHETAMKHMPWLIQELDVPVISARSIYEAQGFEPQHWKVLCFQRILQCLNFGASEPVQMLSIGDGWHERDALLKAGPTLKACSTKSVKFLEQPPIVRMTQQLQLCAQHFEWLIAHAGSLDLCVQATPDIGLVLCDLALAQQASFQIAAWTAELRTSVESGADIAAQPEQQSPEVVAFSTPSAPVEPETVETSREEDRMANMSYGPVRTSKLDSGPYARCELWGSAALPLERRPSCTKA